MNLLTNKKIAIIGAGPVGLTMAKLLQQKGIEVTVYERDKDAQARIWGGTLDLHKGTGLDAMENAGLLTTYFELAVPMGRNIVNEKAQILLTKSPAIDNPEINRNNLRRLLLESLESNTIVWDRKLTELEESNGKWVLHFENNLKTTVDFVIGANGGMSTVRKYVTDAIIENTGTYILQGEVFDAAKNCSDFYRLCGGNILMVAKNGVLLVSNPNNNGALTYNVMFKIPQEWKSVNELDFQNSAHTVAFLSTMLPDWNECYHELFRSTNFFVGLPTRKISVEKPWKEREKLPITLIGDAAHIMPPFAGEGVNIGLLDTIILSENLTNGKFESIAAAINDYEQKMFVYATEAQLETSNNEVKMFHPDFSFEKIMR